MPVWLFGALCVVFGVCLGYSLGCVVISVPPEPPSERKTEPVEPPVPTVPEALPPVVPIERLERFQLSADELVEIVAHLDFGTERDEAVRGLLMSATSAAWSLGASEVRDWLIQHSTLPAPYVDELTSDAIRSLSTRG